jgi:hypothetical protein
MLPFLLMLAALSQSQQQDRRPPGKDQAAQRDQRGTDSFPVSVKLLNSGKTAEERADEAKRIDRQETNNDWTMALTGLLALANIGLVLVAIWQRQTLNAQRNAMISQENALRDTITEMGRISDKQSADMRDSIIESRNMIDTMETNARRELRAYLTIEIGDATSQDRMGGIKFAIHPILRNSGKTPGHKVRFRSHIGLMDRPLPGSGDTVPPRGFAYPLPKPPRGSSIIGANGGQLVLVTVMDDFVNDHWVSGIRNGTGPILCVWGEVTYEDIFGSPHWLKFSYFVVWSPKGTRPETYTVWGTYSNEHNDSDREEPQKQPEPNKT